MGSNSSTNAPTMAKQVVKDPFSVYVPLESLTKSTIRSIISVATTFDYANFDYSERTLLIFLLKINRELKKIETETDTEDKKINEESLQRAKKIREWLVDRRHQPLDWDKLEEKYKEIEGKNCDQLAKYYGSKTSEPYFELTLKTVSG